VTAELKHTTVINANTVNWSRRAGLAPATFRLSERLFIGLHAVLRTAHLVPTAARTDTVRA